MWCYRQILQNFLGGSSENASVLQIINKDQELLKTIRKEKLEYLCYIMGGVKNCYLVKSCRANSNVGRRKTSWLYNLCKWYECRSIEPFRRATNNDFHSPIGVECKKEYMFLRSDNFSQS